MATSITQPKVPGPQQAYFLLGGSAGAGGAGAALEGAVSFGAGDALGAAGGVAGLAAGGAPGLAAGGVTASGWPLGSSFCFSSMAFLTSC